MKYLLFIIIFIYAFSNVSAVDIKKIDNIPGTSKIYISKSNPDIIYTYNTTVNEIFKSVNGGIGWEKVSDANLYIGEINADNPAILYGSYYSSNMESYFFFSTDSGKTWTQSKTAQIIFSYLIKSSPHPPYAVYTDAPPKDSSRCLLSVSYDTCKTWQCIDAPSAVTSLLFPGKNDSLMYIGTYYRGVYRSKDMGGSWDSLGLGGIYGENYIAIDPNDQNIIYSARNNHGVYKTTDGGITWKEINNGLNSSIFNSLILNKRNPQHLFIGTEDNGVFVSINSGEEWTPLKDSQADEWVYGLSLDDRTEKLYFSTQQGTFVAENIFTSINEVDNKPLAEFKLYQNYPNPFNPSTTIRYSVRFSGNVKIVVFDIQGKEIATLHNKYQKNGNYKIVFNPITKGINLVSGIYFYKLISDNFIQTKKMVYLK